MNLSKSSRRPFPKRSKYYRINYNILAQTVRVLDEKGKQIGVFSKDEALRRSREQGMDLVEIAPMAKPPVCKIIDFKKFRYLESKKERESKKKTKNVELKQILLSPFIGQHDLLTKQEKGRQFLKAGHRLKLVVRFKGRQLGKKEFGFEIINKLIANLEDIATIDRPPHSEGQFIAALLISRKKRSQDENENQQAGENENQQSNSETIPANQDRQATAAAPKQQTPKK